MKFQLLGPVTAVIEAGRLVDLGGPMHQLFVAILLTESRHVSTERLIDLMWPVDEPGSGPPPSARQRLHEIACDIRRSFRAAGCDAHAIMPPQRAGYWMRVDRDDVDLLRFLDLRARARPHLATRNWADAVRLFRAALREWGSGTGPPRAEPFAGLSGRWARHERESLRQAYVVDLVDCIHTELVLGRHHLLIPELVELGAAEPYHEQVAGLLMAAYYGAEQAATALQIYAQFRRRLMDDIGSEPGERLRELHRQILCKDPSLTLAARPPTAGPSAPSAGHPAGTSPSTFELREGQTVDTFNYTGDSGIQAREIGSVHQYHYPQPAAATGLAARAERLRKALHESHHAGDLGLDALWAAEGEIDRALRLLAVSGRIDGLVSALEDFKRLVDGADGLATLADEMAAAARRGER